MKVFLCHASRDSEFVIQIARFLKVSLEKVFFYEDPEQNQGNFIGVLQKELATAEVAVIFVGEEVTDWQEQEITAAIKNAVKKVNPLRNMVVFMNRTEEQEISFRQNNPLLTPELEISLQQTDIRAAIDTARQILDKLQIPRGRMELDLPFDPHLFEYEKDIIQFFQKKYRLGDELHSDPGADWQPDEAETELKVVYRDGGGTEALEDVNCRLEQPREKEEEWRRDARKKLLNGCPSNWPTVERWEDNIRFWQQEWGGKNGKWKSIKDWSDLPYPSLLEKKEGAVFRGSENSVMAAVLSSYHRPSKNLNGCGGECMVKQGFCFPEAGPRRELYFPPRLRTNELKVAILVSGGIAPGINAVIDGIVQRHWLYAQNHNQTARLTIYGLQNGFRALDANFDKSHLILLPDKPDHRESAGEGQLVTSDHANEGGSMLGTSRDDDLMDPNERIVRLEQVVSVLRNTGIDILYVIGGDGSMKAAHAIWSLAKHTPGRPLSVVAVPKTMDNDVLWVWQAFGFLSAVEKAREIIEHLHTEVKSNPRLCVLQLFGSDSGFVVSHSVLASATGHCDVALIPEVPFSMVKLAKVVKENMCKRKQLIPYGLVVMAETAIPTDAMNYVAPKGESPKIDLGLTREEQDAILEFEDLRAKGRRIEGQTSDILRVAGLKIVSKGLEKLIPSVALDASPTDGFMPEWDKLRVLTSEPRHLLRSVSPSCSDVIFAQRLGMLAVDSAMAGFTDFMISQWLTEYAVVPLSLVVLGRKRIPGAGIFWKSVLAKTHQPDDMEN